MEEVVRLANAHGMYFGSSALPRMSNVTRATSVRGYSGGLLSATASMSSLSNVPSWKDNAKTLDFVVVMTVKGYLVPLNTSAAPRRMRMSIDWDGPWVDTWLDVLTTVPAIAMQNDPTANLRANYHALYALSGSGSRVSTAASPFTGFVDIDMTDMDVDASTLVADLCLFDVVRDTVGLV